MGDVNSATTATRARVAVAEESVSAGLAGAAFAVAAVVGATGVADVVMGGAPRWSLAATAWANAMVVAALGTWHHRRAFSARGAAHAAGVCAVACALSSATHLALSRDPVIATYLVLTVVSAGAVLPLARWLFAVDAVALAGYAPLAVSAYSSYQWRQFGVALLVAAATGHILQALRARGSAQLQALTEALAAQARHDQLTGLLNRRGLADAVGPMLRDGGPAGVVCLDVDGFKRINDELGHAAGDAVLVEIAARLRELRTHDACVPARLGGDEFALIVPGQGDGPALDRLAHLLRIRLAGTAGVLALPWAVSVGTACGTLRTGHDVERLLSQADLAMYGDKQLRREARRQTAPDPADR